MAVNKQQTAYNSIRMYFNVVPPPYEDGDSLQNFLRCYVENFIVCTDMSVAKNKTLIRAKILHQTCQLDQPDSVWTWQEYGVSADILNNFFTELRTTIVDPQCAALSKVPGKKLEVTNLKTKITQALSADCGWSLEVLTLLQLDVSDLLRSIRCMADDGVSFNVPTIGATRDDFTSWREALLKKIKVMSKTQSDKESKEKALAEVYNKSLKTRKLPDITGGSWARFLYIWRSEGPLYNSDLQRLSIIRDRLQDPVDKSSTEHMTSLPEVMAYLYNRYGTEAMVVNAMISDLLLLPAPRDSSQEEINLANISSLTSICDSEDDLCLFSMEKIRKIVNSALIDSTRNLFWNGFLASKQQVFMTKILTTPTAVDSWEHVYEKEYSRHRVTFLNSFIKMRLEVLRNMNETSKKRHESAQTAHRDDKNNVRAYL